MGSSHYTDAAKDLQKPFDQQNHQPLAFVSGRFTGTQKNWTVIEKEAFPIIDTIARYQYLFGRVNGFRIFSDHRNLSFIFNPHGTSSTLSRTTAAKITRWMPTLAGLRYTIEHIVGEQNHWADLLSHWESRQNRSIRSRQFILHHCHQIHCRVRK